MFILNFFILTLQKDMIKKKRYSKEDLIDHGLGVLNGSKNGKLPMPPMLMLDRIVNISEQDGKFEKGLLIAELDINEKMWFFNCHFKGDPVMPGCLGLDGMWQIVGFYLTWLGEKGRGRALGVGDVKFKGQIRPYHTMITYKIDIKKLLKRNETTIIWADGEIATNDRTIYFAKNLQVGLFQDLTYDFGADPSLDSF